VVDCAGPFQASDYRLASAAVAAGAHYLDIADGRSFISEFAAALEGPAQTAGVRAVTGASSTPALSDAALSTLVSGWIELASAEVALYPGAKAPRGLSVVRAVLSYAGRPVRLFSNGAWTERPGWSGVRRTATYGLGRRWLALCETSDLDLIPQRHGPKRDATFMAGAELTVMHLGLYALSWAVRLRLLRSFEPLAPALRRAAETLSVFGSRRGGMHVEAWGRDGEGRTTQARWSLQAERDGPYVPVLPAAALLRSWVEGPPGVGAGPCVGVIDLQAILAESAGLDVRTRIDRGWPEDRSLHRRLLGAAFEELPSAIQTVHEGEAARRFPGRAVVGGSRNLAANLARAFGGFPHPGWRGPISVEIAPDARGERWTRRFGHVSFASRLQDVRDVPGRFSERFGPLTFVFDMAAGPRETRWTLVGWSLGPIGLPLQWAPTIRAVVRAHGAIYRFSVVVAHPWVGVLAAYAGRLQT
jgi:hypothetical protein